MPLLNNNGDILMPSTMYGANKLLSDENKFIVVGLGPAGLATSILLEKLGKEVIVYEKAPSWESLFYSDKNSYPIGINERTLQCFDEIDDHLRKEFTKNSILIENWVVRDLFNYKSSTCYSSTRNYVVSVLYDHLASRIGKSLIHIHFNSEVTDIDIMQRRLYIKQRNGSNDFHKFKTIDFSDAKIIAADGVNSIIREACADPYAKFAFLEDEAKEATNEVEAVCKNIVSTIEPCNKIFRVFYASERASALFDKEFKHCNHYIYDGLYISCVLRDGKHQWIMAVAVDASERKSSPLLLDKASPERLSRVRTFLYKACPLLKHVIMEPQPGDPDELASYFDSRIYRNFIVQTDRLNFGESILLVGDSAHAVIPPVGEGFNSAMEDAVVLYKEAQRRLQVAVCEGPQSCQEDSLFSDYNERRIKDAQALGRIAIRNNANLTQPERTTRAMLRLVLALLCKIGILRHTAEDYLFGPMSRERKPYKEIENIMNFQQLILTPILRMAAYPVYYMFAFMYRVAEGLMGTPVE